MAHGAPTTASSSQSSPSPRWEPQKVRSTVRRARDEVPGASRLSPCLRHHVRGHVLRVAWPTRAGSAPNAGGRGPRDGAVLSAGPAARATSAPSAEADVPRAWWRRTPPVVRICARRGGCAHCRGEVGRIVCPRPRRPFPCHGRSSPAAVHGDHGAMRQVPLAPRAASPTSEAMIPPHCHLPQHSCAVMIEETQT